MARGGVERAAFGVLDAWVEVDRRLFGAARVVDALFPRKRIYVGVVKRSRSPEIDPSCDGSGIPAKGSSEVIFASASADSSIGFKPSGGEIAGVRAGGALPVKRERR